MSKPPRLKKLSDHRAAPDNSQELKT
jgi:hypothetical protein